MIAGTSANCKIKSITISDTEATIICIIYSSSPAKIHKPFKFYLRDKDKTLTAISENIYWIDRINNYNNDSINIDVNQYIEVILKVDITKGNTADVVENKWVRHCNLILKDLSLVSDSFAWVSEDITLVSKEFEIPSIYNLDIYSDKKFNLYIDFQYKYKSQQDFNYNNKNLYTTINILSLYTGVTLETLDILEEEYNTSKVSAKLLKEYSSPIQIQIQLKNNKGDILKTINKIYSPVPRETNTYIKTKEGIKKVLAFYVKASDTLSEEVE